MALVLNCVWGIRKLNLLIISLLIWISLTALYLTLLTVTHLNWWALFVIGVPPQAILLVLLGMGSSKHRKENMKDASSDASASAEKAD